MRIRVVEENCVRHFKSKEIREENRGEERREVRGGKGKEGVIM